jgi:hypothetical protein
MGLEDEVMKACKGIVFHKVNTAAELRRTRLEKCITNAVETLDSCNKNFGLKGIKTTSNSSNCGYEVNYSGESISGTITVRDVQQEKTGTAPDKDTLLSVTCKAHSCVTQSFYQGEIPETDIREFIKYATRGPTLNDRLRRMAGQYHGDF